MGDGIESAYDGIFRAIQLRVTFSVDELVVVSDETAYALTRSNGEVTVLASGAKAAEAMGGARKLSWKKAPASS